MRTIRSGIIQLNEGLRMWKRARHVRKNGFHQYAGTPEDVCRSIIDRCYDKHRQYYRVSAGHFCEYYVRDFALCCESLVDLGHGKEVRKTLGYALGRFEKANRITTAINPGGEAFDYYLPSGPESIGLFLYSFTHTGNSDLAKAHAWFLQTQVDRVARMIDRHTLLPKGTYSTIRDQTRRKGSCYDMVMLCVVAREARALGLKFPYTESQLKAKLMKEYWNGTYFFQDLGKQPIVISDANIFPFWTGIVTEPIVLENAITAMQAAQLDDPFPIRYVGKDDVAQERTDFHIVARLSPDYETSSIWMHLGLAYLRVLMGYDPAVAKARLEAYTKLIDKHRNFLEVYDERGEPLRRGLYITDESMLWCANWMTLNSIPVERAKKR